MYTLRSTSISLLFLPALSYTSITRNTEDSAKIFYRVKKKCYSFSFCCACAGEIFWFLLNFQVIIKKKTLIYSAAITVPDY